MFDDLPLTEARQAFHMRHKLNVSSSTITVYFDNVTAMTKREMAKLVCENRGSTILYSKCKMKTQNLFPQQASTSLPKGAAKKVFQPKNTPRAHFLRSEALLGGRGGGRGESYPLSLKFRGLLSLIPKNTEVVVIFIIPKIISIYPLSMLFFGQLSIIFKVI